MNAHKPAFFSDYLALIDTSLKSYIKEFSHTDARLADAIHYSTLLGGAIELIHAYSLIHDDLPAMDNDNLRRGQPTCHIAFDEATAILAGDALQAMAFELIASKSTLPASKTLRIIQSLSKASGARGMVYGQALDFDSVGKELDLHTLEKMHRHKTGVLIEASVTIGALTSKTDLLDSELMSFKKYAQAIGLAFQVQDDILDIISDTATLGKKQGADEALNKPTYPALLGLDGSKNKLYRLHSEALNCLIELDRFDTTKLADISHFIIERVR